MCSKKKNKEKRKWKGGGDLKSGKQNYVKNAWKRLKILKDDIDRQADRQDRW